MTWLAQISGTALICFAIALVGLLAEGLGAAMVGLPGPITRWRLRRAVRRAMPASNHRCADPYRCGHPSHGPKKIDPAETIARAAARFGLTLEEATEALRRAGMLKSTSPDLSNLVPPQTPPAFTRPSMRPDAPEICVHGLRRDGAVFCLACVDPTRIPGLGVRRSG